MDLLRPEDYRIVWIAPLRIEARAARLMLDKKHTGKFPVGQGDDHIYEAGEMCGHNIVIATLPFGQEYGTGSAAALAAQAKKFFPNLWFGFLVGVAAGIPDLKRSPSQDIRLGDVLVGIGDVDRPGIVAYELGRETGGEWPELLRQGNILAQTASIVRSAIGSIELDSPDDSNHFLPHYEGMKDKRHPHGTFRDPGQENDKLYQVDENGIKHLVERQPRPESERTRVWYGPIGSGEKLMKNAAARDKLRDKYGIIGIEMEAAGTMNRIPVGVIRGVCDYADEDKNWDWQPYAAAMAAAYAKAVLSNIPPASTAHIGHETHPTGQMPVQNHDELGVSIFTGKGNQNIGSGSISIGGGQHFS
ncbi:nucleoside phosphorylase domain-containing protein [Hypoxylon cercidicola]|nr:nucleoside phosphorylase domain-containing protein [Hypoxylon cercidicola]